MAGSILIIGATGVFGSRLAAHLPQTGSYHLFLGSRSRQRADALVQRLRAENAPNAQLTAVELDAPAGLEAALRAANAQLVVDCSGPFQTQNYASPRIAAAAVSALTRNWRRIDDIDIAIMPGLPVSGHDVPVTGNLPIIADGWCRSRRDRHGDNRACHIAGLISACARRRPRYPARLDPACRRSSRCDRQSGRSRQTQHAVPCANARLAPWR